MVCKKYGSKKRYKQPHSLKEYDEMVRDRVHNTMKYNGDLKKYQTYLKPMRKRGNGHKTKLYKRG